MPLGAGDDGYEVNAPKGYPCGKAAQQRRKSGKIQKKELKKLAAQRQRDAFEKSLPMSRAEFERLFEFLTRAWRIATATARIGSYWILRARRVPNEAVVLDFCEQNGWYCDCEVLSNVQNCFEF